MTTKLEKLKAATEESRDAYYVALYAECACDAATDAAACAAATDATDFAYRIYAADRAACEAELKKTKEKSGE
jgi:hypothetical protein